MFSTLLGDKASGKILKIKCSKCGSHSHKYVKAKQFCKHIEGREICFCVLCGNELDVKDRRVYEKLQKKKVPKKANKKAHKTKNKRRSKQAHKKRR